MVLCGRCFLEPRRAPLLGLLRCDPALHERRAFGGERGDALLKRVGLLALRLDLVAELDALARCDVERAA